MDARVFFFSPCTAKLAISIARKMNALIFLVPEDIVDVRPRLVCVVFFFLLFLAFLFPILIQFIG
jgi:hypothetical protein